MGGRLMLLKQTLMYSVLALTLISAVYTEIGSPRSSLKNGQPAAAYTNKEEQSSDSNASDVSGIYDKLVQPCSIKPNIVPLSYYDRVDRRYIKEADPLNNAYALEGVCIEVTDIRPNGCSVTIKNSSEYQLGYSDGYHLEKYYGSNIWGRCEFWDNRIHSVNDILHTFGSDSEKALKYDWTCEYGYLPSGRYRIRMDILTVSPQRIPKRANYFEVCAEFIID